MRFCVALLLPGIALAEKIVTVSVKASYTPPSGGGTFCDTFPVGNGSMPLADQPAVALVHSFHGYASGEDAAYQFVYLTMDTAFDPQKNYTLVTGDDKNTAIGVAGVHPVDVPAYAKSHWDGPSSCPPVWCVHPASGTQDYGFPFGTKCKSANSTALLSVRGGSLDITPLTKQFQTLLVVATGPSLGSQSVTATLAVYAY